MTILGAVTAVIVRKFRALVAEIRILVNAAAAKEKQIFGDAKAEAVTVIEEAKRQEQAILTGAKNEAALLKNELLNKLASI